MKADIFFCISVESSDKIIIERILATENLNMTLSVDSHGKFNYSSQKITMDFDDLGESILIFCKKFKLPNISYVSHNVLGYVQVLVYSIKNDVNFFISNELASILSRNGFGLDIHHK